jgi:hypothetical protein
MRSPAQRRWGGPETSRHRATTVGATHRDRATADTAGTAHSATARDPPARRPRPHQFSDRRTTRGHRKHRQMARQTNPRQDRLNQPCRGGRPRPAHGALDDIVPHVPLKPSRGRAPSGSTPPSTRHRSSQRATDARPPVARPSPSTQRRALRRSDLNCHSTPESKVRSRLSSPAGRPTAAIAAPPPSQRFHRRTRRPQTQKPKSSPIASTTQRLPSYQIGRAECQSSAATALPPLECQPAVARRHRQNCGVTRWATTQSNSDQHNRPARR